jgi:hypothetical protein
MSAEQCHRPRTSRGAISDSDYRLFPMAIGAAPAPRHGVADYGSKTGIESRFESNGVGGRLPSASAYSRQKRAPGSLLKTRRQKRPVGLF